MVAESLSTRIRKSELIRGIQINNNIKLHVLKITQLDDTTLFLKDET